MEDVEVVCTQIHWEHCEITFDLEKIYNFQAQFFTGARKKGWAKGGGREGGRKEVRCDSRNKSIKKRRSRAG